MISSIFTLIWQIFILFACCLGVGLNLRLLIPKEFSLLNKVLFPFVGGLFLAVLIAQNLVYLGVPVRISGWLLLGLAFVQGWLCRHKFRGWMRTLYANADIRTLGPIALLIITFHGIAPVQQGLEWYYGKGYPDHINYVLLAEFLKEEPYSTNDQDIGLRPWLVKPAFVLKKERIGQSIITAEISVWSGTDGKAGYAATIIFFLTVLAFCLYALLRGLGLDRLMAGSGALLAALLPAVTRLSLDGFLSQVSILFVFPFSASLLRCQDLRARSFILFFSLSLAYVVAAYSEIAPIGLCTLFFGVIFVRPDKFRNKRLILMSAILLIALMNPYYVPNLIGFLAQQYYIAANATFLDNMAPNVLTLRGWSELIFGATTHFPLALFFDYCAIFLGLLFLTGGILLSRRDKLVFGVVLLPGILIILYLAIRTPPSYYPIAKIILSVLPFAIGLVFVALSRLDAKNNPRPLTILIKLLSVFIPAAAAIGSMRYYSEVLNNGGLLKTFREPRFQDVCLELERMKNKRVFIFENDPLLTPWLCFHARHNDVYVKFVSGSALSRLAPFSKVPELGNIDFEVTRDRIVELKVLSGSPTPR